VTFFTERLDLSHNDIHMSPYSLISVGYGWRDFNERPADQITCRDNRVTNNRLSGSGRRLGDGGAIYALGRMEGTNEFSGNFIYCDPENEGFECRGQNWGLYADQGPKQAVWKNNVVENYEIWMNSLRDPESRWEGNWTTSSKQEWRANEPVNTHRYSLGNRPAQVGTIFENSGLEPEYRAVWDGRIRGQTTGVHFPNTGREQLPQVHIRNRGMSGLVLTLDPGQSRPVTVTVCDAQGRIALHHRFTENSPRSVALSLDGTADGVRFIRVQQETSKAVYRTVLCR
jgi:hypothetical protein